MTQNTDIHFPDFTPVGYIRKMSCGHEHPYFAPDLAKARRVIERCRELGGTEFWASPDIVYMLVEHGWGPNEYAHRAGLKLRCKPDLPPNSLISAIGGEILPARSRA